VKLQSVLQEGFQGTVQDSFTKGKKYALDVDLKVKVFPSCWSTWLWGAVGTLVKDNIHKIGHKMHSAYTVAHAATTMAVAVALRVV